MLGKVELIKSFNGYECELKIFFEEINCSVWCYSLSLIEVPVENNVETIEALCLNNDRSNVVKVGEVYDIVFSVVFVNKFNVLSAYKSPSFTQFNNKTTHTLFIAIVKDIVDDNLVCDIGILGSNILVILETSVDRIKIGEAIEFSGEIKADLVC